MPHDPAVLRKRILECHSDCPPTISRAEAAAVLMMNEAELAEAFGSIPYFRTASVRSHLYHRERTLLEPPPKHVTRIIWPGVVS